MPSFVTSGNLMCKLQVGEEPLVSLRTVQGQHHPVN